MTYDLLARRVEDIARSASVPLLVDANAGFGDERIVARICPVLEASGAAGIAIEDKLAPRRNSFGPGPTPLVSPGEHAAKIYAATRSRRSNDFLVVARLEGLIAGLDPKEVEARAELALSAGADAVIVHSKSCSSDEVEEFARAWHRRSPLLVIPTTYPTLTLRAAADSGISAVIYANQLMRAAMFAMRAWVTEALIATSLEDCGTPLSSVDELLGASVGSELFDEDHLSNRANFAARFDELFLRS